MVMSAPPRIPQASAAVAGQLAPAGQPGAWAREPGAGRAPGWPGSRAGPGAGAWFTAGGPGRPRWPAAAPGPGALPGLWMMALAHRLTRAGTNALNRTPSATSVNSGPR